MAIDPDESAGILCDIASALAAGTQVIMTIKLPTLNVRRWLPKTTEIVETAFEVEAMRHLFHNRQEVTALLRRRVAW
jgi:23S rRNA (cytidine2498-2'-O)-methyltransferase